ncbi:lysosomal acid phosphatase [Elysia marginata]|uniref:acid phosphatase n=1 Tax=Elysia marginata TaxID=1093978 RepID=A0AAV4FK85_9GAST|nr:lysosomal acid phosphatase [Elysia marginata]
MHISYKPLDDQRQWTVIFLIISNIIFSIQSKSVSSIHNAEPVNKTESGIDVLQLSKSSEKLRINQEWEKQYNPRWKAGKSVLLTQVVFRHGDRSATHTYPTDPHVNDWVDGLGQLSKVYVRSTNLERTLMSAECVCAGLFPVNTSLPDLPEAWPFGHWQPVPVQTVPSGEDKLLHPADTCSYVQLLKDGILAMDVSRDHIINDKNLMYKLSRNTGMEINVKTLHDLADTLFCQLQHNMSQPDWFTKDIQDRLLEYGLYRPHTGPTDVKYLSGTLLDVVIKNMKSKAENSSDLHKMYLYSAHDSTVAALMSILRVDNFIQVPYSAAFFIELHLIQGQYFVKLLYRNSTTHPPQTLIAPRCLLELCPLKVFDGMHRAFILSDEEWNEVCPDSPMSSSKIDAMFPVLLGAIVALIGVCVFSCYKAYSYKLQIRQGPNQDQYGLVQNASDSEDDDDAHARNGNVRRPNGIVKEYHDNDEDEDSV